MSMTLEELKSKLAQTLDEVTLLELLKVTAEELVEALSYKIEEQYDTLVTEFDSEEWATEDYPEIDD